MIYTQICVTRLTRLICRVVIIDKIILHALLYYILTVSRHLLLATEICVFEHVVISTSTHAVFIVLADYLCMFLENGDTKEGNPAKLYSLYVVGRVCAHSNIK